MHLSSLLLIGSLFYTILILILFFTKETVKTLETRIYKYLIISSLLAIILDLVGIYSSLYIPDDHIMRGITLKLYYGCLITIISLLSVYVFLPDISVNYNKFNKSIWYIIFSYIAVMVVNILLPYEFFREGKNIYAHGMNTTFLYIFWAINFICWSLYLLFKSAGQNNKRFIPIITLVIMMVPVILLQLFNPEFLLITSLISFIVVLMYHTIENPDLKLINELNLAKDSAVKANRAKSEFLSSMSHEIRTPLNAIVGFSNMISEEDNIKDCKTDAKYVVEASNTLLEIVNGILDISKIEANKMEIIDKHYDLESEMLSLTKLVSQRIGEKPLKLNIEIASDIPGVLEGDIGKIKQIITNVLTNSVKYTEYGQIDFNIRCINKNNICSLVMSVKDTGRGIKTEQIDKLFNKFDRLEHDKNTTIEGTGLGLAITKALVELLGGKIIVQSEYGEGTIFTIYLNQKIISQNKIVTESLEIDEIVKFKGKEVLIVDDNLLNIKIAEKVLQQLEIKTTSVTSGNECLKLIKKGFKPDLILMDDMMPEMTGTETFKILKEDLHFNIKTVVLTANAIDGMEEKYLTDGFDGYLAKPFEKKALNDLLSMMFEEDNVSSDIKILLIDDNSINLKILSNFLKNYGFKIDKVTSGKEGLKLVEETKYDLIFIDYMMPEMNGIEVLENLKKISNFNTKAIMVTADATDGSKERFLDAGFDEYIAKPIDKNLIKDVVNKYLTK